MASVPTSVTLGGLFRDFDELLRRHSSGLPMDGGARPPSSGRLLAASLACCFLYGAAVGCFQDAAQAALAAVKAVAIGAGSLLLCLPSLYVFSALRGADFSGGRFLVVIGGFAGMVAALLVGLAPISWLFSVSSVSATFVVVVHVFVLVLTLSVAGRFLRGALQDAGARGSAFPWLLLLFVVSLQMTTVLRPVLWRETGAPLFAAKKMFFLSHFGHVLRGPAQPLPMTNN